MRFFDLKETKEWKIPGDDKSPIFQYGRIKASIFARLMSLPDAVMAVEVFAYGVKGVNPNNAEGFFEFKTENDRLTEDCITQFPFDVIDKLAGQIIKFQRLGDTEVKK